MTYEPITPRQFHFSSGVRDWRVADGAPDVDLRPDGVFVRLFTTAPLRMGSAAATSRWRG